MATVASTTAWTTVTFVTIISPAASTSPDPTKPMVLPGFSRYSVPAFKSLESIDPPPALTAPV